MRSFTNPPAAGCSGPDEALAWFDALAAVEAEEMLGAWAGRGFPTGHPLDGVLEACQWHGKRFDAIDEAHPLVFRGRGGGLVQVRPAWVFPAVPLVLRFPALKSPQLGRLAAWMLPLLATRRARARLRMLRFRGVVSAAMLYDELPIADVFRRIDDDNVLGLMDLKGMPQPFFFLLQREGSAAGRR